MGKQCQTLFLGAPKSLQRVIAAMKLKSTPWKKSYDQPRQHIKKQRHYFANKGPSSQGYGFSSSHVWVWRRQWQSLQYSCLENPRDGGAWWAAVSGVAQSQTRLKQLSSSSHFLYSPTLTSIHDYRKNHSFK